MASVSESSPVAGGVPKGMEWDLFAKPLTAADFANNKIRVGGFANGKFQVVAVPLTAGERAARGPNSLSNAQTLQARQHDPTDLWEVSRRLDAEVAKVIQHCEKMLPTMSKAAAAQMQQQLNTLYKNLKQHDQLIKSLNEQLWNKSNDEEEAVFKNRAPQLSYVPRTADDPKVQAHIWAHDIDWSTMTPAQTGSGKAPAQSACEAIAKEISKLKQRFPSASASAGPSSASTSASDSKPGPIH